MGDFRWEIGEDDRNGTAPRAARRPHPRLALILAALIVIGGFASLSRLRLRQANRQLIDALQQQLTLEIAARDRGDVELMTTLLGDDGGWLAAQFDASWRLPSGMRVTAATWYPWGIVAEAIDRAETRRTLFFVEDGQRRLRVERLPPFWESPVSVAYTWGSVTLPGNDIEWLETLASVVDETVAQAPAGCATGPLDVVIQTDFSRSAAPNTVWVPSAHLLGLGTDQRPTAAYWDDVAAAVTDTLGAADVRFAVPEAQAHYFAPLARAYAAADGCARITLQSIPEDAPADAWVAAADAALARPTPAQIIAGNVRDLTEYAFTDPAYAVTDHYRQIWRGGTWRERLWLAPHAAAMRVLYVDNATYARLERPLPGPGWTWREMVEDVTAIAALPPDDPIAHALLPLTPDLTYAYALSHGGPSADSLAAAATWFDDLAVIPGAVLSPDVFIAERQARYPRTVAMWVDIPLRYEYYLGLGALTVVPFPANAAFESVAPLWVDGFAISAAAEHPVTAWRWLTFLSHQPPPASLRHIPARPSVATETEFWETLPGPLAAVMRPAFATAQPVELGTPGAATRTVLR